MTIQPIASSPQSAQRGATLMVAMIFLIVLSLLGIAAVQNNTFQEKMAGNSRDRELAFEAAEAAIQDAKFRLSPGCTSGCLHSGPWDGSAAGLSTYVATNANDAAYWNIATQWTTYVNPTTNLPQVATQPQYRIEKKPDIGTNEYYRVTARGFGSSNTTIVILQAEFTYTP
jgi:type IV pilus assembly protein PilX